MTILGAHTVAELKDLLASYDYQLGEMVKAEKAASDSGAWMNADPTGWGAWLGDWLNFQAQFGAVSSPARALVSATPSAIANDTPAGTEGGHMFDDCAKGFMHFADIDRALRQSPAASYAPNYANNPQPSAPDFDLNAYQVVNNVIKTVGLPSSPTSAATAALIGAAAGAAIGAGVGKVPGALVGGLLGAVAGPFIAGKVGL